MSLLELRGVQKSLMHGGRRIVVLRDACLQIEAGELVAVWGTRGSGRTTLLRLAAGIDRPDAGSVSFEGRELSERHEGVLGARIGYCRQSSHSARGQTAMAELLVGLLAGGVALPAARMRAREALERIGAERLSTRRVHELDGAERLRLALACALAREPRMLVLDEPLAGVELHQRDEAATLLRSLADEGVAILMTVGEPSGLAGSDQALTIGEGELRGSHRRELAPVLELRPQETRLRASG